MRLYEVAAKYAELDRLIADDETQSRALTDTLASLEAAIEDKVHNIAAIIKNLGAEIDALKNEEKRLAERRKSLEAKQESLKLYIETQFTVAGLDKVKTPLFTVAIRKNSQPTVKVVSEESIPSGFWIPQDPVLNKKAVIESAKNGMEIPGVELEYGRHLRIQ